MKTFWLIVTTTTSPKILAGKVRRVDGNAAEVVKARNDYADELGPGYIVTAETDGEARRYKSYRQFKGSDEQAP